MIEDTPTVRLPWLTLTRNSPELCDWVREHGMVVPIPHAEIEIRPSEAIANFLNAGDGLLFLSFDGNPVGGIVEVAESTQRRLTLRSVMRARIASAQTGPEVSTPELVDVEPLSSPQSTPASVEMEERLRRALRTQMRIELRPACKDLWREIYANRVPEHLADRVSIRCRRSDSEFQQYLEEPQLTKRLEFALSWLLALRKEDRRTSREFHDSIQKFGRSSHALEDLLIWSKYLRDAKIGDCPSGTNSRNTLLWGQLVLVSVWSPGRLKALSTESGKVIWSRAVPKYASRPFAAKDAVLINSSQQLLSLDPSSGRLNWRFRPYSREREWFYSEPAVGEDEVVFSDNDGVIHCVSLSTGAINWQVKASEKGYATTPLIEMGRLISLSRDNEITGHNIQDGKLLWRLPVQDAWVEQILPYRETCLVHVKDALLLVDHDGLVVEKLTWPGFRISSHCIAKGLLLLDLEREDRTGYLVCQRGKEEIWKIPRQEWVRELCWSTHTGLVYEVSHFGITAVRPETGERLFDIFSRKKLWIPSAPTAVNDRLYVLWGDASVIAMRHPQYSL